MTAGQVVQDGNLVQQAAQVPPAVRAAIGQMAIASQRAVNCWPYYSSIGIRLPRVGAAPGPYTYDIPQGQMVQLFGYGVGDDIPFLGVPPAPVPKATFADTNISQKFQTVKGQTVMIWGIALHMIPPGADAFSRVLWEKLMSAIAVSVLGGGQTITQRLGPLALHAQRTGLFGPGREGTVAPSLVDTNPPITSTPTLANPIATSYFPFPYGLKWQKGATDADSEFGIQLDIVRPVHLDAPADRPAITLPGVGAPTDVTLNTGYVAPIVIGGGIVAELIVSSAGKRSANE